MPLWEYAREIESKRYKCGHCNSEVASNRGWMSGQDYRVENMLATVCPHCKKISFFDFDGKQIPAPTFGNDVQHLPEDIEELYNEARNCMQVNAFTSVVMDCRKLLMHIAVGKGADENMRFIEYVNYLDEHHFTPPDSREWVDTIRQQGNDANHEINMKSREDAEELIDFIEMILRFTYEFPGRIQTREPE